MLKIIHTADWHLGQTLHGISREYEHQCFLDWLLEQLKTQGVDALIIAGDIFDSANPAASAQQRLYRFLAAATKQCEGLDVIIIAGNHDSAARIEAPSSLLKSMNAHAVGSIGRNADGKIITDSLLIPLHNKTGTVAALCAAVPFLRPADLPPKPEANDPLIEGVRAVYSEILSAAMAKLEPHQALIVTGHCYMVGGSVSDLSERRILGGNQHALPADIFGSKPAYIALGHLHRAQKVGGRKEMRYSGSPIPLSLSEDNYPHQVRLIEINDGRLASNTSLKIPRAVAVIRIGARSPSNLIETLTELESLETDPALEPLQQPLLEVTVKLEAPEPGLHKAISDAIEGKAVRLLKIGTRYSRNPEDSDQSEPEQTLEDLTPEQVFLRCYAERYEADISDELMAAFHRLESEAALGDES